MSKNRIKQKLIAIGSRAEAEAVVGEIARITLHNIETTAKRDAEIEAIRARYQPALSIGEKDLKERTAALCAWAEANPAEFGKAKSIKFVGGTLGFRTGTPKLALLNRSWNWEKVTAAVAGLLPNFIRNKPEVDKEAMLGQRDELGEYLVNVGLKVTQDEGFYVEPNITAVETRQVAEVA